MQPSTILAVVLFSISTHAQSILDALTANNATQFAQFLQANPSILAVYNSSAVQTVFAPTDAFFNNVLQRRAGNTQQQYEYQYSNALVSHSRSNIFLSSLLLGRILTRGLLVSRLGWKFLGLKLVRVRSLIQDFLPRRREALKLSFPRSQLRIAPRPGVAGLFQILVFSWSLG
jgi:hypothetical protein